jgi:hypothetical protein
MNEKKICMKQDEWVKIQDRHDCINFHQRESWMIDDRKMISKVGDE